MDFVIIHVILTRLVIACLSHQTLAVFMTLFVPAKGWTLLLLAGVFDKYIRVKLLAVFIMCCYISLEIFMP